MTTLLKVPNLTKEISSELHFMPAEIQYNGSANVKSYFETNIRKKSENKMTASLRGRPLHGTKFEVPSGYTGVIFNESKKSVTEDDERELTATGSFDSFNYWNLDREPSHGDRLHQALTWIDIAKALHSPVDNSLSDSQGSLKSEASI
ncbi:ribonuclease H2 subunit C-like [Ruditapes philippinarum]|uniref:ribonuclease H2 subunit C-like n=1 Tax=Ruditapes philippinarum TaxID=129788 RepID=UPI00295B95AB|nr:ribonuclease H2 subunit C-like [Ruditapes philippinarum]